MRRAVRADSGFTLVEVLLVVVLSLILAGVVLPAAHTLDDQVVLADAQVLAADLEFARARAIATGVEHRVVFRVGKDKYVVQSPPGTVLEEPLSKKPWRRKLAEDPNGPGTDLVSADFGGERSVTFDASGAPQAGGTVVLRVGNFEARVVVEAVTGDIGVIPP